MSPQTSTAAITATGLRKTYGEYIVLDAVDLHVTEGTVFALLGPNGAGKTTIIHILSTLLAADAGTASVAGHDVVADTDGVRGAIGVTGQFSAVDGLLTGKENLLLMADLRHLGGRKVETGPLSCSSASTWSKPPISSRRVTPVA